jgi:SET domain-containing protein
MLHKHIEVRPTPIGKGLVAKHPIRRGEVVWSDAPRTPHKNDEITSWPDFEQERFFAYAYQVGDDEWIGGDPEEDHSLYMNHSCDPNTWHDGDWRIVARRDINPGEEVTYDYATSQTDPEFVLLCRCATVSCRSIITGHDHRKLRSRYAGHMMEYIEMKK